eukprot:jgi/Botrbrau1/15095/Bobra.0255s0008.1
MAASGQAITARRQRSSGAESFLEASGSIDAVFGTGESGLPMWFNPERFLEADFDAADYVADLRRSVPLETLAHGLEHHLATLKAKLVEVINEDYNDFISLSTKLVNVDGAVLRMQKPLLEVKEKLTAVQAAVGAELEGLGEGLQRRQQIASARALLELMQDAAHVMSKVEKLLAEVGVAEAEARSPRAGPSAGLDARSRMFERLASEISRLSFQVARGKDLLFIQQLQGRMEEAAAQLQVMLAGGLRDALKTGNVSARTYCLQAYAAVGDTSSAEQVVKEAVVKPIVDGVLAAHRQRSRAGPVAEPLSPVLEEIAAGIRREVGPLLEAVLAPQSGLHAFNFLANSLLLYVDSALADALPGAFSPGVPASFLANYSAAMRFLDELESYCQLSKDIAAFRSAAAYDTFLRRWKLSIYFSLRFQEVAGGLETVVAGPGLAFVASEAKSGQQPLLELLASQTLHQSLLRCGAEDVYVPALADKFLKLALQLLSRYTGWLATAFATRAANLPAPLDTDVGPGLPGTRPTAAAPPGPPASEEGGGEAGHWAVVAGSDQFAAIRSDVDALSEWLRSNFAPSFSSLLASSSTQVAAAVRGALEEAAGEVGAQGGPAMAVIVGDISERCAVVCKQMNGITATYRMTTRPLPSRPSHYVGGILGPLRTFLDAEPAKLLREAAVAELSAGTVDTVARRYASMAVRMLETLRKTESSLKRLKKNRTVEPAADGSQLSDIDKISLQLFLDVEEFGRQAAKFGVVPADLPGYQELWRNVAPPEKQDAIQIT